MYGRKKYNGPLADNYDAALLLFIQCKPKKGFPANEIRQLAYGKNAHMEWHDDGRIDLVLYSTPCVTFYPNGEIDVWHGHWRTPTTVNFINDLTTFYVYRYKGEICIALDDKEYCIGDTPVRIKNGRYVSGASTITKTVVDRALARELRTRFAAAALHLEALVALEGKLPQTSPDEFSVVMKRFTWRVPKTPAKLDQWVRDMCSLRMTRLNPPVKEFWYHIYHQFGAYKEVEVPLERRA